MGKKVAVYARVSTDHQTVENQLQVLREVAEKNDYEIVCEYIDSGISGAKGRDKRPQFDALIKDAVRRKFDLIMCWDISRLGRSLQHLVGFLSEIQSKNVDLYIHQQGLDTSTPTGKMMFQMVGCFAEYERNIISERVRAGLDRAKREGKKLGRPTNVNDGTSAAIRLLREQGLPIRKIARELGIGVGSVYNCLDLAA